MHTTRLSKIILGNFILVFSLALLLSATDGSNLKEWDPANKLTWKDYRDTTVTSKRVALTSAGIQMSYKTSDYEVIVYVHSQMDRNKSWADSAKRSDRLLSHEQYHFNITEYWSRKLKKEISSGHFTTKNFKEKVAEMQKQNFADCKEMQTQYDLETKHSLVKEEQAKWEKKIGELLKKTEEFSDKTVNITLSK